MLLIDIRHEAPQCARVLCGRTWDLRHRGPVAEVKSTTHFFRSPKTLPLQAHGMLLGERHGFVLSLAEVDRAARHC
jgi:hypothetical protein